MRLRLIEIIESILVYTLIYGSMGLLIYLIVTLLVKASGLH